MRVLIGIDSKCNRGDKDEPRVVFLAQLKSLSMDTQRGILSCHMDGGVNTMLHMPGITQEFFMEIVRAISKSDGSYVIKDGKLLPYL